MWCGVMTEDISKKTIMVLVVLTIIVSALGTLTVLDSVSKVDVQQNSVPAIRENANTATGQVSLKIKEPDPVVTGNVILNLVKE